MITVNNEHKMAWHQDLTIKDIFKKTGYSDTLYTITVNGQLVPKEEYDSFKVPDNVGVKVFFVVHGG